MEPKLTPLQEAHLLNSMKTNDATRRRSWWSLVISVAALIVSFVKDKPIPSFFETDIIYKTQDGYYFVFLSSNPLEAIGLIILALFTVATIITVYGKLFRDLPFEVAVIRNWPVLGIFLATSIVFPFLKAPTPLLFFIITLAGWFIAVRYFFLVLVKIFTQDKYAHLKEKRHYN